MIFHLYHNKKVTHWHFVNCAILRLLEIPEIGKFGHFYTVAGRQ